MSNITATKDGHYSTRCPGCKQALGPYGSLKPKDSIICQCGTVSEVNNSNTLVVVERRKPGPTKRLS